MQWLSYAFLRLAVGLFSVVPYSLMYRISDGIAFVLYSILPYRKGVMRANLKRAFPEKTDAQINPIMREAYRNLSDLALETLKGFSAPIDEIKNRIHQNNIELLNKHLDAGHAVILCSSHYNNWEWHALSTPSLLHGDYCATYKPLSNKWIDDYFFQCRTRGGCLLSNMNDTFAMLRRLRNTPVASMLLGDQSPSSRKNAHWVKFMGIETAFLPGLDFMARKLDLPVIYFHLDRTSRGHYSATYIELCANGAEQPELAITRAYAAILEEKLREKPENWLWTHRRWKMQPEKPSSLIQQ